MKFKNFEFYKFQNLQFIKWQSIIYELIRSKKVDPWDIDLSKFSEEYMSTISKLKSLNFRISGKVVLAAALMLKIKTKVL